MDNWSDGVDMDGDPVQSGLYHPDSQGVAFQSGLVIGIVLSVNPVDSEENMLRTVLVGDGDLDGDNQASYVEANVLSVFSGHNENMVYQNCVVLPSGKTSRIGPTEDEPSDFSEDVPNGCTPQELDAYYSGKNVPIEDMTGDWVVLGFIGGMVQLPVILSWFPNPYNKSDPATITDGKRWRLRRNNTDLLIDKDGNFSLAHRGGNFLQMNGKSITLKHVDGSTLFMDDEGKVTLVNKDQMAISISSSGININAGGDSLISLNGDAIRLYSPTGEVNVVSDTVNVMTNEMTVGATGGQALANETLANDAAALVKIFSQTLIALQAIPGFGTAVTALLSQPFDLNDPSKGTLQTVMTQAAINSVSPSVSYVTKALSSD